VGARAMSLRRALELAAAALIAGTFATRAAVGLLAAPALDRGTRMAAAGSLAGAIPLLDRAAIGASRTEALWLAGESRLGLWDAMPAAERRGASGSAALQGAVARFLQGQISSPATGWFLSSLSETYARREALARASRSVDLSQLDRGRWALVGDDGCVAIGLARWAVERQPTTFELCDRLVLVLEGAGLREEAEAAMAETAKVLPDFGAHTDFTFEGLRRELLETFWRTARDVRPEDVPIQNRERQLLAAGILGRRLGHLEEAEADLRAALTGPGAALHHAEDAFHLGLLLIDRGRLDEAEGYLRRAEREPVFVPGTAEALARIERARGRLPEALAHLRRLREHQPRDVWTLVEFARVARDAGEWAQAEEALRWAIRVNPDIAAPRAELVELLLAKGERVLARSALEDYERLAGRTDDVVRLEAAMSAPLDPAPH